MEQFNFENYLEGATVYTLKNPAKESLSNDYDEDVPYIPEDVLAGKKEWKLKIKKDDFRNKEGIIVMQEV